MRKHSFSYLLFHACNISQRLCFLAIKDSEMECSCWGVSSEEESILAWIFSIQFLNSTSSIYQRKKTTTSPHWLFSDEGCYSYPALSSRGLPSINQIFIVYYFKGTYFCRILNRNKCHVFSSMVTTDDFYLHTAVSTQPCPHYFPITENWIDVGFRIIITLGA